jgi:hypothetical protein
MAQQEEARVREETRAHMGLQEWEEGSIMALLKKAADQQPSPPTTVVVFSRQSNLTRAPQF